MKIKLILLSLILAMLPAGALWADEYYVSPDEPDIDRWTNPDSAVWAAAKNIDSPCDVMTAFKSAKAGDTVYFRGGTYNTPEKDLRPVIKTGGIYYGYYNVKHSGTDKDHPIIFMAYPGDSTSPVFNGTSGGYSDLTSAQLDENGNPKPNHNVSATIFGTTDPQDRNLNSWIVFDGFVFQADNGTREGRMMIGWCGNDAGSKRSRNIIVRNCVFNGGNPIPNGYALDSSDGLRIEAAEDVTVSNCILYNYVTESEGNEASAFKSYDTRHVVFENCEIYGCDIGLFFKSSSSDAVVKNCFIHDNAKGISITPNTSGMIMDGVAIYNNLFIKQSRENIYWTGSGCNYGTHGNNFSIYNNTFYKGGGGNQGTQVYLGYAQPGGHGTEFYNNIVITGSASISLLRTAAMQQDGSYWVSYLKAVDHNQWGTLWSDIFIKGEESSIRHHYYSFNDWENSEELENPIDVGCDSSKHPGCGDLTSDPEFVNGSGTWSELADFALKDTSPCKMAGREHATDIGADVSFIGIKNDAVSAPEITGQPQSTSVTEGQSARFTVYAKGLFLQYQWYKNGSLIAGATGATYTTPPATMSDNGASFYCIVENSKGSKQSNSAAVLTVIKNETPPPGRPRNLRMRVGR